MVYGILGRFPLYTTRMISIIKYWIDIVHCSKSRLVYVCYQNSLQVVNNNNRDGWVKSVRDLLFRCGLGEAWYNQGVGDAANFINVLRNRLFDIFRQDWHGRIEDSPRARFYRAVVGSHELSYYLNTVYIKTHRVALSRLILSSHSLTVESGRWNRPVTPASERYCPFCPNIIEDEFHFILQCSIYHNLRMQLIPKYYIRNASMAKLIQLFTSKNKQYVKRLGKFIYKAFLVRDSAFQNM